MSAYDNDLMQNLEKIRTTELGVLRIKRNLELETNDVVKWCKNKIKKENEPPQGKPCGIF